MEVRVDWKGDMAFDSVLPSGGSLRFDNPAGPTPMESVLAALGACTGMDVVSILEKMRQHVTAYRIEVEGDRPEPGVYPRPFTTIKVKHVISGVELDPQLVEKAVNLSDEKYCSVSMTLKRGVAVESSWVIE